MESLRWDYHVFGKGAGVRVPNYFLVRAAVVVSCAAHPAPAADMERSFGDDMVAHLPSCHVVSHVLYRPDELVA